MYPNGAGQRLASSSAWSSSVRLDEVVAAHDLLRLRQRVVDDVHRRPSGYRAGSGRSAWAAAPPRRAACRRPRRPRSRSRCAAPCLREPRLARLGVGGLLLDDQHQVLRHRALLLSSPGTRAAPKVGRRLDRGAHPPDGRRARLLDTSAAATLRPFHPTSATTRGAASAPCRPPASPPTCRRPVRRLRRAAPVPPAPRGTSGSARARPGRPIPVPARGSAPSPGAPCECRARFAGRSACARPPGPAVRAGARTR